MAGGGLKYIMGAILERRKYILDAIVDQGFVKVSSLATKFGVTQTTIRKDLNYLESQGLLYRAYGSALPTAAPIKDISLETKKRINYEKKQKIAEAACSLIEPNDSIIIASGSTMAVFADHIKPKDRLNVVTSAVNISASLGETDNVTVMQVGGILYSNTLSVSGNDAIEFIRNIFCNKLFFGGDGLDPQYGVTCAVREEAELTKQMMQSSKTHILLCDSTKLGRKGFARICPIEDIDILITDDELPAEGKEHIEAAGVKVIIA